MLLSTSRNLNSTEETGLCGADNDLGVATFYLQIPAIAGFRSE